ncbi:hypothetical protein C0991_006673 [Blastosporella zonata]|nr:hypothetical protein C0991_006673 [Blastosporella zonata]
MRIDINNISNAAIMNVEKKHDIKTQLGGLSPSQWNWAIACFFYPYAFLEPASTLMMKKTTYDNLFSSTVSDAQPKAISPSFWLGRLMVTWEGIPAVLMGIATFWVLPDYPQTAKFLDDDEKSAILGLLTEHSPSKEAKTWDWHQVIALFKDPTFWTWTLLWFFHAVGGFGLSYALPTVIFQLGFTTSALSNVLSMPPSSLTFIVLNTLGWLVQSRNYNPFRIAITAHAHISVELVNIICCALLLTVKVSIVKYLALCVATATAGSVYPILWPSRVKAARGTTATGVAIGITNATSQFSGILGPSVFSTIYGPTYRVSYIVCSGLLAGSICSIVITGILMGELLSTTKPDENNPGIVEKATSSD